MNIGAWITRRHARLEDPCDPWDSIDAAPQVKRTYLYAKQGRLLQEVEQIDREIAELEGK